MKRMIQMHHINKICPVIRLLGAFGQLVSISIVRLASKKQKNRGEKKPSTQNKTKRRVGNIYYGISLIENVTNRMSYYM